MKKQILLAALAASITLFGANAVSAAEPASPPAPANAGVSDIATPPSRSYMDSLIQTDRAQAEAQRQERPGRGPAPEPERRFRHNRHPAHPPGRHHRGAPRQGSLREDVRDDVRRPAPPPGRGHRVHRRGALCSYGRHPGDCLYCLLLRG